MRSKREKLSSLKIKTNKTIKKIKPLLPTSKKNPSIKKFYLSKQSAQEKLTNLQESLKDLENNKTKRKRIFSQIAKLKKAISQPEIYLIDPNEMAQKQQKDKERRIQKKIFKSTLQNKFSEKNKNKICLHCKIKGHVLSECKLKQEENIKTNICYNCGKTNHLLKDCKKKRGESLPFAKCFFCKQEGHIAKDCPQNEKGLYTKGGGCYICDSTRHTQRECPNNPINKYKGSKETVDANLLEDEY